MSRPTQQEIDDAFEKYKDLADGDEQYRAVAGYLNLEGDGALIYAMAAVEKPATVDIIFTPRIQVKASLVEAVHFIPMRRYGETASPTHMALRISGSEHTTHHIYRSDDVLSVLEQLRGYGFYSEAQFQIVRAEAVSLFAEELELLAKGV